MEYDFYNTKRIRNSSNTNLSDYNCGGYALNTFSWYEPYNGEDVEEIEEEVAEYLDEGWSVEQIYEFLASQFVDYMIHDIKGLRLIDNNDEVKKDERLIYFRFLIGLVSNFDDNWEGTPDDYDYVHVDFHYRFFEDGHWHEKNGVGDLKTCDGDADNSVWVCGANTYDSPIIKFALKKQKEN